MAAPLTSTRNDNLAASVAARRAALVEELAVEEAHVAELRSTIAGLTGQSDTDSILEREIAERSLAHALEALGDIRDALARIDAGTYGRCEGCGEPIPAARLEAIPSARRCVTCPPAGGTLLG